MWNRVLTSMCRLSHIVCSLNYWKPAYHFTNEVLLIYAASEHPFNGILSGLPKPGGGEFGKFYSLPALNDPRIGMVY